MGLHNRGYMHEGGGGYPGGGLAEGMTIGMPKPARGVKWLLVINFVAFVVQAFDRNNVLSYNLGVTLGAFWQVWRYFTFQFLHAGLWHILLNMLGLYMLGTPLEKKFGTRKFIYFYLSCGVVAGLSYVVIASMFPNYPSHFPIVGASGGVYGIILAAAVYFPQFRIIFVFFPVPIRMAALVIFGIMLLTVLKGLAAQVPMSDTMSHAAHLGGTIMAALWIWVLPQMSSPGKARGPSQRKSLQEKLREGAWEQKMEKRRKEQAEIDRILQKIHEQGIQKLTAREKRTLKNATRKQREDDSKLHNL